MHKIIRKETKIARKENRKPDEISMILTAEDHSNYEAPKTNEIAIIYKNDNGEPPLNRDLLTWPRRRYELTIPSNNKYKTIRIDTKMAICDPMQYPIIFPYGDSGWSDTMKQDNSNKR